MEQCNQQLKLATDEFFRNQELLDKSNLELKNKIKETKDLLKNLELSLINIETPIKNEISKAYKKRSLLIEKREILQNVSKMEDKVRKLYSEDSFNKIVCLSGYTELIRVFMGSRYSTYFYNDTTGGFYTNEGKGTDKSWSNYGLPHIKKENEIEFSMYEAYEIALSNISDQQKFDKLGWMFNKFLI